MRAEADDEPEARPRALGELKAQKPGEKAERSGAVRLDSHAVRVKIAGSVARTEVEEVFTNQTDDVLEGIFRFPLPPDAKIERLALEVDGKLEEGAFVDRERAAAIWRGAIVNAAPQLRQEIKDEIVWVPGPWRDPALLEWQRGGRFELRIFPIPKRGSRRVVLAYSQLVKQSASVRHYSYPLGFDPSGNSTPLDFSIDVQVRGHDPAFRVRTPGWDVSRRKSDGAEHLRFDARSLRTERRFRGRLRARRSRLRGFGLGATATPAQRRRGAPRTWRSRCAPSCPSRRERGPGRAVALVVDASRSVFGENYRRATSLATRMARDLEPADRVTVLACDSTCREMPGELRPPGAPDRARGAALPGARDARGRLGHHVRRRARLRGAAAMSGRAPHVVYIGDGTATAGPTRPATIERAVRAALPAGGRVTSARHRSRVGRRLAARAGARRRRQRPALRARPAAGDAACRHFPRFTAPRSATCGSSCPQGISQVAPARLDPIVAGSELVVTGRLDALELKGDAVLRGTVNGRPFEQRYPLDLTASDSSGNAFVPRLFAAARIADLERDGSDSAKREAVALSTRAQRGQPLHVAARARERGHVQGLRSRQRSQDARVHGRSRGRRLERRAVSSRCSTTTRPRQGQRRRPLALNDKAATRDAGRDALQRRARLARACRRRRAPSLEPVRLGADGAAASAPVGAAQPARKPAFAPPPAADQRAPSRSTERAAPEKKRMVVDRATTSSVLEPTRPRPRPPHA